MDFVQIPFAASPEAFLDKYLNPNLLDEIQNQTHLKKKKENENPSVGMILCASKDDEVVEYAMSRTLSPMMVAEFFCSES